jgi:hypothetical protein
MQAYFKNELAVQQNLISAHMLQQTAQFVERC